MQIIVIGCGKVGSSLARELVEAGNEVVIIENDRNLLTNADDIDCIKINGVPIDKDVLKSAGIETADAVCAVTQDDNMNIMTSQVAKEIFKVDRVIARIFNPGSRELFEEFGLETICSTSLTVDAILRTLGGEQDENTTSWPAPTWSSRPWRRGRRTSACPSRNSRRSPASTSSA